MRTFACLGGAVVLCAGTVHAGLIDPTLDQVLRATAPDDTVSALVYLVDQLDADAVTAQLDVERASFATRHEVVVRALQDMAQATQGDLVAHLDARVAAGDVKTFRAFWIANAVHVTGTPAALREIANLPDVDYVYFDYETELVKPTLMEPDNGGPLAGQPEPGLEAVRAPEVWAMGITGAGVLTSTLDTGVDGNHEALASRWQGLDSRYSGNPEWAWFDPVTFTDFPQSFGSHGTHTMGSVCGGAPGDIIGVAPGATWIHAATIDRISIARTVSDSLLAFEWVIDPDGNPATAWDVPRVCSNSWRLVTGHGYPPCDETFWRHLDNCHAAGVMILFSAGNEGNGGVGRPPDRATDEYRTVAVAAIDARNPAYPIAGFSSRGPTFCTPDGSEAIKPDISGPGVNVRSSVPGNGYAEFSGTSMASPHVNGVVCLMYEANPDLTINETIDIFYETALDLGPEGEDNSYGYGLIDAVRCVEEAIARASLSFQYPDGRPELIDPFGGTTIRVDVVARQQEPEPGTGKMYYRSSDGYGDFIETDMTDLGDDMYEAVFPTFPCGSTVDYYFSIETTDGETINNPISAPASTYTGLAYTGTGSTFEDDFEEDLGWSVNNTGNPAGAWDRGVPEGGPGAPTEDSDGSGQCYLTGVANGVDLDSGTTRLDSPTMDASAPQSTIAFDYWFYDGDNPTGDVFIVDVSDDGGASWDFSGFSVADGLGGWVHEEIAVSSMGIENNDQFRVRFRVNDSGSDNTVEAAVDAVMMLGAFVCEGGCAEDLDGSGAVDFGDVLEILAAWGPCDDPEDCPQDLDDDDLVGFSDLLAVLSVWGPCE